MSRNPNDLNIDEYQASHIIFQYYNEPLEFQKFISRLKEEGFDDNFIDNAFKEILNWAVSDEGAVQYANNIGRIRLQPYEKAEAKRGKVSLTIKGDNGAEYVKEFSLKQAVQIVDIVRYAAQQCRELFKSLGYSEDIAIEIEAWFSKWPFSTLGSRVYENHISQSAGQPIQNRVARALHDLNSELRSNKIALKITTFNGEEYAKEFSLKQALQIADIVRNNREGYQKLFKHLGYSNGVIKQMADWFSNWSYRAGYGAYESYISQTRMQPGSRIVRAFRELDTKEMEAIDAEFLPATEESSPRLVPLTRSNFNNYYSHTQPASVNIEGWRSELPTVPAAENVRSAANARASAGARGDRVAAQDAAGASQNLGVVASNAQRQHVPGALEQGLRSEARIAPNSRLNEVSAENQPALQTSADNLPAQIPNATSAKRPGFIERCRRLLSSCFSSKVSPQ